MEKAQSRKRVRRPPEVRHEEILDAASRVLVDRGLSAATMSDVAAEAGVAKGTVYLYFDSKERLLSGLGARYTERLLLRSGDLLEGDGSGSSLDRFDRFLEEMIDFYLDERELHCVLFHERAVSEAEAMQRLRELMRVFIERGVESEEFEVTGAGFTADFLLHGLHGALLPVLHQLDPDRDRFLRPARELVRKTLGAWSRT
jgi:TetR/AcrR family transcriptional regulator, transcriptional repressor for nem operon